MSQIWACRNIRYFWVFPQKIIAKHRSLNWKKNIRKQSVPMVEQKPSTSHSCYIKNIGIASLSKIDHRSSLHHEHSYYQNNYAHYHNHHSLCIINIKYMQISLHMMMMIIIILAIMINISSQLITIIIIIVTSSSMMMMMMTWVSSLSPLRAFRRKKAGDPSIS